MRIQQSARRRGMHGAVSLAAVLLCGACERSSTPSVDTSGFQLVVPSPSGEYAVCAKWAKGAPRWEIPQTFELRGESGVLWSQTLSAGLWAAAVTDNGTLVGCFAPGAMSEWRDPAQLLVIDRTGSRVQNIQLPTRVDEATKLFGITLAYAIREDEREVWLLRMTYSVDDRSAGGKFVTRYFADRDPVEVALKDDELAEVAVGNLVSVPGSNAAAIVCYDTMQFGGVVREARHNLFVAIFDIESGDCLGMMQFDSGVERAEVGRISAEMAGIWGIRSGLCVQVDGRDSDDEPVYAMIRVVEGEGGGRIETEYVGPRAEALAERTVLPVVRWVPE